MKAELCQALSRGDEITRGMHHARFSGKFCGKLDDPFGAPDIDRSRLGGRQAPRIPAAQIVDQTGVRKARSICLFDAQLILSDIALHDRKPVRLTLMGGNPLDVFFGARGGIAHHDRYVFS